jgi:AmmeMemoRadiSam system protein B/AmmeMemoRadiSam system protein A
MTIRKAIAGALCLGTVVLCAATGLAGPTENRIRESVIAGTWYPGDPESLKKTIKTYLDAVPEPEGHAPFAAPPTALIVPHAGYRYSGQVAAHAYKRIRNAAFDTVFIVAPSHRVRFSGVSIYGGAGYRTPLGVVPVDRETAAALMEGDDRIRYVPEAHAQEHALEIQLPFLQVVLGDFKLVPLVMGDQRLDVCRWLARKLASHAKGRSALIVASTDLSHYHSYEAAKKRDKIVLDRVAAFDPEGLNRRLASGACEACGGGPMVTAMLAARHLGADRARVLHYANSGDVTGDRDQVVGYMAAGFWKAGGEKRSERSRPPALQRPFLTAAEKALLHDIARESIAARLRGASPRRYQGLSPALRERRGAFVTLKKGGRLRGCIGHIAGRQPLADTVCEMAQAAAFEDPRFPPVTPSEAGDLQIEISAMTPLKEIDAIEEIQVGTHGLYIVNGSRSGLLLPQVASENGWDCHTFLEQTCRKAGLPKAAWKAAGTRIFTFSADVF